MKKLTSGILTIVTAAGLFNASMNAAFVRPKKDAEIAKITSKVNNKREQAEKNLKEGETDTKAVKQLQKEIKEADSYFAQLQKRISEMTTTEKAYAAAITLAVGMLAEYGIRGEASYTAQMFNAITETIVAYTPESVKSTISSGYNTAATYLSPIKQKATEYSARASKKASEYGSKMRGWFSRTKAEETAALAQQAAAAEAAEAAAMAQAEAAQAAAIKAREELLHGAW